MTSAANQGWVSIAVVETIVGRADRATDERDRARDLAARLEQELADMTESRDAALEYEESRSAMLETQLVNARAEVARLTGVEART